MSCCFVHTPQGAANNAVQAMCEPMLAHADIRQGGSSKCLRGVKSFNSVLSL